MAPFISFDTATNMATDEEGYTEVYAYENEATVIVGIDLCVPFLISSHVTQRSMPMRTKQRLLSLSWRVMLLQKVIHYCNAITFQLSDVL